MNSKNFKILTSCDTEILEQEYVISFALEQVMMSAMIASLENVEFVERMESGKQYLV